MVQLKKWHLPSTIIKFTSTSVLFAILSIKKATNSSVIHNLWYSVYVVICLLQCLYSTYYKGDRTATVKNSQAVVNLFLFYWICTNQHILKLQLILFSSLISVRIIKYHLLPSSSSQYSFCHSNFKLSNYIHIISITYLSQSTEDITNISITTIHFPVEFLVHRSPQRITTINLVAISTLGGSLYKSVFIKCFNYKKWIYCTR